MRIRSIKPEFWRSPDVTSLAIEDRLLFIGLWSYVDDNGVGRDELPAILGDLFAEDMYASPRETVARVQRGLAQFETDGLITRYTVSGRRYLHITTWEKHQKIDRPSKPRYPGPDQAERDGSARAREDASSHRDILDAGAGEQGAGEQGNREQGNSARDRATTALELVVPEDPQPTFDDFWNAYPRAADKPAARKAWANAIKATPPDVIIAGALAYANDPNREDKFTKYPGPWLNAEAWNNPPEPARGRSSQESSFDRVLRQNAEAKAELAREEATRERNRSTQPAISMGNRRPA